jgi:RNA polymerase sigma factor (sigma-70 family)
VAEDALPVMPDGGRSDEELWALMKGGTDEAFSLLYSRHASRLLSYLYRMLGDAREAEKAFDEVILSIHGSDGLYTERSGFLTTLYATARRYRLRDQEAVLETIRGRKRQEEEQKRRAAERAGRQARRRKGLGRGAGDEEPEGPEGSEAAGAGEPAEELSAPETDGVPMEDRLWTVQGPAREKRVGSEVPLFSLREAIPPEANTPEQMAEIGDVVVFLQQSLGWMADDVRDAVIFHLMEGLSYGEIAEIMEITPVAARDLVRRGLDELRQTCVTHA